MKLLLVDIFILPYKYVDYTTLESAQNEPYINFIYNVYLLIKVFGKTLRKY